MRDVRGERHDWHAESNSDSSCIQSATTSAERINHRIRGAVGCGVCETGRVWQLGSMSAERHAERDGDVWDGSSQKFVVHYAKRSGMQGTEIFQNRVFNGQTNFVWGGCGNGCGDYQPPACAVCQGANACKIMSVWRVPRDEQHAWRPACGSRHCVRTGVVHGKRARVESLVCLVWSRERE